MKALQIELKHLNIIKEIIKKSDVDVYVFGSRVKHTAKPFSDLDLCIKDKYKKSQIRKLQEAFEESDLPFKVDLVIWDEISETFKRRIEPDLVKLQI